MAVEVMIKRKFKQHQAQDLIRLIIQLRCLATCQPGYISGETLRNINNPGECMVISTWQSVEDWDRWFHSKDRKDVEDKIHALLGEKTEYEIYSPLVGRVIQEHFIPEECYTKKTKKDI